MTTDYSKKAPVPRRFIDKYLSPRLDLRVRLFNVLAMAGTLVSLVSAAVSPLIGEDFVNMAVYLAFAGFAAGLLWYSEKSGRYQLCYLITIVVVFLIGFPFFFFLSGAYFGTMPYFFIFAIVFTVFMLEGGRAIFVAVFELLFYTAICLLAYRFFRPEPRQLESATVLSVTIFGFVVVSAALSVCVFLHFRLYNAQQKKLDEQNAVLAGASRMKSEFLSNASHEMRTPLTVISVNVQTVADILEDLAVKDPDAEELLGSAQSEIMRLSRMVGGMLTLASMSENTDRHETDFTALLTSGADMLRLYLDKRGNLIETEIQKGLTVFGNADLLAQVLTNLLQNAGAHTENGKISLTAAKDGGVITVTVRDTGSGISPEMLPHVFDRGVSTGGTGFGLYLCKTVIDSHGGRIWIESEPGEGTAVYYTLPVYEGQFGGDKE